MTKNFIFSKSIRLIEFGFIFSGVVIAIIFGEFLNSEKYNPRLAILLGAALIIAPYPFIIIKELMRPGTTMRAAFIRAFVAYTIESFLGLLSGCVVFVILKSLW